MTIYIRTFAAVLLAGFLGWAASPARAAVFVPQTGDGDFGAQTSGNPVGLPWTFTSGTIIASSSAQSPFTNTYAANGIGATVGSGIDPAANPYIVGAVVSPIVPTSTLPFTVNVDFDNTDTGSGGGAYDFIVTSGASWTTRTGGLYVTGSNLYMDTAGANAGNTSSVATLSPNTWYDAQLTFNPVAHSYTGTLTPFGGSAISLPTVAYVQTGQTVNSIYTDSGSSTGPAFGLPSGAGVTQPAHNIDNFALFAPVNSTLGSAGVVNIDFNGIRGTEMPGATYVGVGAAGGGAVFNGITADSTGGSDQLTISGANLLNSVGGATGVTFSASTVGGDNANNNATVAPIATPALIGDYIFTNSSGNAGLQGFLTISGINGTTADLYFYAAQNPAAALTVNDGHGGFAPEVTVVTSLGTAFEFLNVPVINGMITGTLGTGSFTSNSGLTTDVLSGLTIVANGVPEPGSLLLFGLGAAGLVLLRRRHVV